MTRVRTTHTGSLPRPNDLAETLEARARGESIDEGALERRVTEEVRNVVRRQVDCGLDFVNDGEAGKYSYAAYVKDRLTGFSRTSAPRRFSPQNAEFPNWAAQFAAAPPLLVPTCEGPISYVGQAAAQRDIDNLRAALKDVTVEGAFLTAASPGVVALFAANTYYPDEKSYLDALSDAMKVEYDMIAQAGFLLQVDCPDLTINNRDPASLQLRLDALNRAVHDIPADRMRVHLCWGNYAGPHNHDTPLRDIIERVYTTRPGAISLEGANPRHGHEWKIFREFPLPKNRTLIPGMIDSTSLFIEHPELVADRIERYASVVGPERVIAGVDCGFATFANRIDVDADIVWAKLRSLVDGARLASEAL
jgi:5-methyltetrahydropteroyltriglutamate--homocysteine methyltransferase